MKEYIPLFRFRSSDTPVHRISAGIKLAVLAILTIFVFAGSFILTMLAGATIVLLAIAARIPWQVLLRNLRIILWYALFILIFRFIGPLPDPETIRPALIDSGLYILRLFLALIAGTVFYETTSSMEIFHALKFIQTRLGQIAGILLRPFFSRSGTSPALPDIAFHLALTITFIPRIFSAWTALNRSWDARGGNLHRGLPDAWKRVTILIPLLIASLLAVAADTERAIRNRSA